MLNILELQKQLTAVALPSGFEAPQAKLLAELALRCTFFGKRTIGSFRVLGYDDILAIYRLANH